MKKFFGVMISLLLISNFALAQSSEINVDEALANTDRNLCQSTDDLKTQLIQDYAQLEKLQTQLADSKSVDRLDQIRKTTGVIAAASGAISLYTIYRGRVSNFKSPILMTLNQYVLAGSGALTKIAGFVALASEAGYILKDSDVKDFQKSIEQYKQSIAQLQQTLQSCDQK